MSAFSAGKITEAGRALLSKTLAGSGLIFTKMELSDNVTVLNKEQPSNILDDNSDNSLDVTETVSNRVQSLNALFPNEETLDDSKYSKPEPSNALTSIVLTVSGNSIVVNEVQPAKVFGAIVSSIESIVTDAKLAQFANVD